MHSNIPIKNLCGTSKKLKPSKENNSEEINDATSRLRFSYSFIKIPLYTISSNIGKTTQNAKVMYVLLKTSLLVVIK